MPAEAKKTEKSRTKKDIKTWKNLNKKEYIF